MITSIPNNRTQIQVGDADWIETNPKEVVIRFPINLPTIQQGVSTDIENNISGIGKCLCLCLKILGSDKMGILIQFDCVLSMITIIDVLMFKLFDGPIHEAV